MGKKLRINITVDEDKLKKAKTKLDLFGGKLSTLFNAYLSDFVKGMEQKPYEHSKEIERKLKELDSRLKKVEASK